MRINGLISQSLLGVIVTLVWAGNVLGQVPLAGGLGSAQSAQASADIGASRDEDFADFYAAFSMAVTPSVTCDSGGYCVDITFTISKWFRNSTVERQYGSYEECVEKIYAGLETCGLNGGSITRIKISNGGEPVTLTPPYDPEVLCLMGIMM